MDTDETFQAEERYQATQKQLQELQLEMQKEIDQVSTSMDPKNITVETITIRPRKSDLYVEKIAFAWLNQ